MTTNQTVAHDLESLRSKPYINRKLLNEFIEKTAEKIDFIGKNNPLHHFGCFFVPYDKKLNQVFFGHHIKADFWIPPGGHIETGETPTQTVIRECKEELDFEIDEKQIEFFNISITHIENQKQICRTHYDLWYIVSTEKRDFNFDRGEFHDMKWLPLNQAIDTLAANRPHFRSILEPLLNSQ